MPMGDLLGGSDSDEEVKFTINEDYAKKYEKWRSKELLQHLNDVTFGHCKRRNHSKQQSLTDNSDSDLDDSSQSNSEDENNIKEFEKPFLQVMAWLKSDDPNKYNEIEKIIPTPNSLKKKSKQVKDKPFLLRDYERNLIVEKGGKLSDDEEIPEGNPHSSSPTYVEEQRALKNSFKQALENSDSEEEDEEEDIGKLFKKKDKTKLEIRKEDDDYKEWLKGRKKELKDKETESQLKKLHDYWTDPKLDSEEAFLRDYILTEKYLEDAPEDTDYQPGNNEDVHDSCNLGPDVRNEHQTEGSGKQYNFRFEEPDSEFIKRYPRNAENSFRRKDDRRKRKRQELRERKEAEKLAKREEIKQLKAIKRKEILAKIEKIKEITGNDDVNLQDEDLEEDFNPEKHDQKMNELFNDDYYQIEEEDKPECPELERDLEIETWENWQGNDAQDAYNGYEGYNSWGQPECEAPDFNMDCDYDPKAQFQNELVSLSKSKKKQRRKSRFAAALAKEKPVFDPNDKKFEQYFDEYYKLDCEDIIGDLPCRFKYRQTTPNDYGLTVDEILRADEKELNRWCSLKKVVKYKPDHVEKYEVQEYKKRACNEALKRKILPSLYVRNELEEAVHVNSEGTKKNKNKKRKSREDKDDNVYEYEKEHNFSDKTINSGSLENFKKQKEKKQKKENDINKAENNTSEDFHMVSETSKSLIKQRKFKKGKSVNKVQNYQNSMVQKNKLYKQTKKKMDKFKTSESSIPVSDDRLRAYGIHPKKFKNKMKYGKNENNWI